MPKDPDKEFELLVDRSIRAVAVMAAALVCGAEDADELLAHAKDITNFIKNGDDQDEESDADENDDD